MAGSCHSLPVRRETNEMGMFPEVFRALRADWGETELAALFATDAGSASLHNATLVHDAGHGYLMMLNDFHPTLTVAHPFWTHAAT
jgi:hypothetical protein